VIESRGLFFVSLILLLYWGVCIFLGYLPDWVTIIAEIGKHLALGNSVITTSVSMVLGASTIYSFVTGGIISKIKSKLNGYVHHHHRPTNRKH